MYSKIVLSFAVCFSFCQLYVNAQKVPITVYYESLCPDSKQFFTTQLYPTLQTNLSKWVNLTLVPYGKSNQTQLPGGQWQFSCHHGANECQGNKIQACALHEIEKTDPKPANLGFNPVTVAFINCLMDKTDKKAEVFPIQNCSTINQVKNYVDIENCASHNIGIQYLVELGVQTQKFQDPLKSVPTIVFNEKYDQKESEQAQTNLVKALCKYITKDKPEECKNCGVTFTASALLFVLMLFKSVF